MELRLFDSKEVSFSVITTELVFYSTVIGGGAGRRIGRRTAAVGVGLVAGRGTGVSGPGGELATSEW